ncbi:preprotein translocase subunit SecE [Candidatus Saccharibacteria bacterium]|nr:preprotein translocase subunit SecE [Candidatus Saccharibacteria bacterium]
MAEAKKKRVLRQTETVREKVSKKSVDTPKKRRLHNATKSVARPLGAARRLGRKEYHPVKLPDNKTGKFLTANRKLTPKFFREAWAEVRMVIWPNRKETTKMTIAVFIFALTFGAIIAVVDYGLDRLFKEALLK